MAKVYQIECPSQRHGMGNLADAGEEDVGASDSILKEVC